MPLLTLLAYLYCVWVGAGAIHCSHYANIPKHLTYLFTRVEFCVFSNWSFSAFFFFSLLLLLLPQMSLLFLPIMNENIRTSQNVAITPALGDTHNVPKFTHVTRIYLRNMGATLFCCKFISKYLKYFAGTLFMASCDPYDIMNISNEHPCVPSTITIMQNIIWYAY